MAGAGYRLFATGDVLTAAQVNTYLQQQTVMVFADSSARTTALSGVVAEGMVSYLQSDDTVYVYNGSAWVGIANSGDITSVGVTSPITGGGTSGAVTIAIQDASTAQRGSVQLSDSTSTTSSTLAATSTAVKSAYDLAAAAIPKTLTTTTGDIIYASGANTPARLGIGSTSQVLSVVAGVPAWSTPASGGGLTLISTVVPSASSGFSFSSISSSYKHLLLTWDGILHSNNSTAFDVRLNANSGANYNSMVYYGSGTSLAQANAGGASSYNPTVPVFGKNVANAGFNNTNSGYLWLYDYANTSYAKQCSGAWMFYDSSGAAHTQIWNSQMTFDILTAISSIDITRISGAGTMTITTNGSVKLWGMA